MAVIMSVNAGSSSLKFQLLDMPDENLLAKGLIERIGMDNSHIYIKGNEKTVEKTCPLPNHQSALELALKQLIESEVIHSFSQIDGVGHRVVHGGEKYSESILIDEEVKKDIEELSELAPLHNPPNLVGIRAVQKILPEVPAVAVFDTAFHQTMKKEKFLYSIPYEYYDKYRVRKYGFHGTSHKYVSHRAAELMGEDIHNLKIISCHIGNGVSMTAIENGLSIDTSMGFTPLAGVAMGTRSGNIDPALIPYIMEKTGQTAEKVIDVLNNKSGLLGMSERSSDLRDIIKAAEEGDEKAAIALRVYATRIHKYIGVYAASLNGVDAIVFTAGVGENSTVIREAVCSGLEFMGVEFDRDRNRVSGKEIFINKPSSPVKIMVIPTNEELMIARDTLRLIHK